MTDSLYVMAAEPEYGPELRKRIAPLMTGIGPVEATLMLTQELMRLRALRIMPKRVISLGSAGSSTLQQTEIYQVASVYYRDMDATAFGFEKGRTPYLNAPVHIELSCPLDLPTARLGTGASVVSGSAYEAIDADMVDMETFALKRVCMAFNVELIGLRGISDGDEEIKQVSDWTQYLEIIDGKLAQAVDELTAQFS